MHYSLTNKAKDLNLVEKFVGMIGGKVEVGAFWGGDKFQTNVIYNNEYRVYLTSQCNYRGVYIEYGYWDVVFRRYEKLAFPPYRSICK
jgi:hypothetical protein